MKLFADAFIQLFFELRFKMELKNAKDESLLFKKDEDVKFGLLFEKAAPRFT